MNNKLKMQRAAEIYYNFRDYLIYVKKFVGSHEFNGFLTAFMTTQVKKIDDGTEWYRARIYNDPFIVRRDGTVRQIVPYTMIEAQTFLEKWHLEREISQDDEGFWGYDKVNSYKSSLEKQTPRRLYASNTINAAISEVRPPIEAFVSVANIRVKEDLKILDFSQITDLTKEASNKDVIAEIYFIIGDLLSKMCFIEEEDQLLIQYIIDFYKESSFEIDGILMNSLVSKGGKNLIIFDRNKSEPISSDIYGVHEIDYTFQKLML